MKYAILVLLLTTGLLFENEPIDPNPRPPKEEKGCIVIVTNQGPIVICR